MPWPAESMLPTITWSTWSPSIPARERTSLPTVAPSSVAGVSLSEPPKVPIPVLRGVEMTISPIPLPLPKLTFSPSVYSRYRGYIKRQDPDHTARASLYTLQRTALRPGCPCNRRTWSPGSPCRSSPTPGPRRSGPRSSGGIPSAHRRTHHPLRLPVSAASDPRSQFLFLGLHTYLSLPDIRAAKHQRNAKERSG